MGTWLPSMTTRGQKWAFYMLSTVSRVDYTHRSVPQMFLLLGVGALASPLVATQFAQLHRWSFHYLVSLGVASVNTLFLVAAFRFKSQDGRFLSHCFSHLHTSPHRMSRRNWSSHTGGRLTRECDPPAHSWH